MGVNGTNRWTGWGELILPEHWSVYRRILDGAAAEGIRFALAGAFATATHTGRWRGTNDMDMYILPRDRERVIRLTQEAGLEDIYDQYPYDRSWTFRATDGEVIVEAIWEMRNHRAVIDEKWLARVVQVDVRGLILPVALPEEIIWPKLYVLFRERCDWPDILNLIYFCGEGLDWEHLLSLLGDDTPLLGGVLCVFEWLCPDRVDTIPAAVWERLGIRPAAAHSSPELTQFRATLLKTSEWFGPEYNLPTIP
ncbi:MAG: hypothetical protein HYX72_01070 [Acidobacteria bacterium]|nr:hypothetical protein [Acidobacteriota bacterium]